MRKQKTFIVAISAILLGDESPETIKEFEEKIKTNFTEVCGGLDILFFHKNITNDLKIKGGFGSLFFEKSDEKFKFPVSKTGIVITQGKYYKNLSMLKKAMVNEG